jgi:hypothetical protein
MAFGNFLNGFSVWRSAQTRDGNGGFNDTFTNATPQGIRGRLTPLGAGEAYISGQKAAPITHRFSCASATDVRIGDEIRGGAETVVVDAVRSTSQGRRKECLCMVITRAT